MSGSPTPPVSWRRYMSAAADTLETIATREATGIERAAELVAAALAADHIVHAFGTGHSSLLAAEMFYRAGGLAAVNPLFHDDLMLHRSASASTAAERDPARGRAVFEASGLVAGDVLVVISNSGGNAVVVDVARRAKSVGAHVIAVISKDHSDAADALERVDRLDSFAHVVIDNHVPVGDAAIALDTASSRRMGPLSTVSGAAIVHAIAIAAAEQGARDGIPPAVFTSSNVRDGDAVNDQLVRHYRDRIHSL